MLNIHPTTEADELRNTIENWDIARHSCDECNGLCDIEEFYRDFDSKGSQRYYRCAIKRKEHDNLIALITSQVQAICEEVIGPYEQDLKGNETNYWTYPKVRNRTKVEQRQRLTELLHKRKEEY